MVATIDALMTRTLPPQRLAALSVTLRPGDRVELGALTERLVQVNPSLAKQARKVLDINKSERHIRGGLATREKYLHQH